MITLDHIAGYMTEKAVWTLMECVAGSWLQHGRAVFSAADIVVEDDRIALSADAGGGAADGPFAAPEKEGAAAAVWSLGALAFYAVTGMHVFDGMGGRNQTARTEVPHMGSAHCSRRLSDLVYRCLAYDPQARPPMEEILTAAREAAAAKVCPARRLTNAGGKAYASSLVGFWPEEMVTVALFLLMTFMPLVLQAQTGVTEEMQALVRRCKELRMSANTARVERELLYDMEWTLMDEIDIDRQGECTSKDPVDMFGINDIGYRIARRQGGAVNTGGRFRNGQDARYRYSFIEITVKKGATVNYEITGREGLQRFAIVPYEASATFGAEVTKDGRKFSSATVKDGVCYVQLDGKVTRKDRFRLTLKNTSGKNMAFVIINHNPGK